MRFPLRYITTITGLLLVIGVLDGQPQVCGFAIGLNIESPEFRASEQLTQQWIAENADKISQRSSHTIPVVFHIVYLRAEDNLSELQIRSQMDILNRDFLQLSENRHRIPEEFSVLEASADLRFCLATTDPDGNPTTGITRTATSVEGVGALTVSQGRIAVHYNVWGGKDAWDPDRYVNIWVANLNGLLGKATFPGMALFPEEDGVIIDPSAIGALGSASNNAPYDRGHTLTHEIGHYLNLLHLWGQTVSCESDDLVDDTPKQNGPNSGCPTHPLESCGSPDMFMNYMALTNDRCLAMFTNGQVARINAALEVHRSGLIAGDPPCSPFAPGRTPLDSLDAFYSNADQKIILTSGVAIDRTIDIAILSIDGRLITSRTWQLGGAFWIITSDWPAGIYVMTMRDGQSRRSILLAVY